ncbi:50S ribosomal protein L22 [Ureaplasma zalophigenitalium]|uniref:50S ribosomal protein L22 n=1 Tax=Ureaplasma zalophigenitalium TaxID=907723 RepID=UPI003A83EBC2
MTTQVKQNNIRISARKAKLVIDLIRNKPVNEALRILNNTNKKFAPIVAKLLKSAIANVEHNSKDMDPTQLYVYKIVANQGPTLKRMLPRAKGAADRIKKRTTHLVITLSDDKNEKITEQQAIKERLAKRKQNKTETASKLAQEPTKVVTVDEQELAKREQQVLKVVEPTEVSAADKAKGIEAPVVETENIIISMTKKNALALFENPEKNVVFYKVTPTNPVKRVIVYAVAPEKKVLGEFDLETIDIGAPSTIWRKYNKQSVLVKKEFDTYFVESKKAHAMIASRTFKYRTPKKLSDYNMKKGPSGFQYLK